MPPYKQISVILFSIVWSLVGIAWAADVPLALPSGAVPNDARLQPLKDLNGYFPFAAPKAEAEWAARLADVRRRILVSQGLWPMPSKTPLNAVIHGKIVRPEYTIEKVYFESAPGFFVTGNLYRPTNTTHSAQHGKVPVVLFAHGHWKDARLSLENKDALRKEIATGQERFERGGQSRFQSMCVQLARMGCIVWQWDMLSDSDSIQFSPDLIHGFEKQRPEMNTLRRWGLYSPQADAHLQTVMGLQTWNAIRSLDFVLSLPEVDAERVAVTGASGGGTQTMILSAIDPRVKLSFPAVMVSTAMQGGCTCENAPLLRIGTGNVEFAALFAPKPLGLTNANDWTKEMPTKGFPELKEIYQLLGAGEKVMLARGEQFPHNYNAVSREAFYDWLNRHFKLGAPEPVRESDYEPLPPSALTVWDADHPAPKAEDPEFERVLLDWFTNDAAKQLDHIADSADAFGDIVGGAVETMIGRTFATAGEVGWNVSDKYKQDGCMVITGTLRNTSYHEELPVAWLFPTSAWNRRVVVWLDSAGKASLFDAAGAPQPEVRQLLGKGTAVLGADLLYQGEFLKDGKPLERTRVVQNPRECAAYTSCYNHSLFAERVHDVLSIVRFLRKTKVAEHPSPNFVGVAGFGTTGPIVVAARAVAGNTIDATAADTGGFRFGNLLDARDPQFLPGGAKYFDLPGFIALGGSRGLWLAGEKELMPLGGDDGASATLFRGPPNQTRPAAAKWLSEQK
ncbi:MAG: acetylxylan esterase [Pirellulales bacterium]|nr:acetylxylan esterase [Pirellulales bacterium]